MLRDIKARKRPDQQMEAKDLFSSMPPLEAFRTAVSLMMSRRTSSRGKPLKLAFFDISRAHFYGELDREVFAELPTELKHKYGDDMVAKLKKSWYGLQDASRIWQGDYTKLMEQHGHQRGRSNGALFYNVEQDARTLCHGDDFCVLADEDAIKDFEQMLTTKYTYKKLAVLGFESGDDKQAVFLNRVLTVDMSQKPHKIVYEPDARHAQLLIRELGLEKASGVETPAEHRTVDRQIADSKTMALGPEMKKLFRSCVMRAAYLAQDDPSIAEAVKSLARRMSSPNEGDLQMLKRLGRYLVKYPMTANEFPEQNMPEQIKAFVDTDHAGCALTRRSTTGLAMMLGRHCVKHSSNIQSTIGLSSGESEWYGLVKGSASGLGLQSMLQDWGIRIRLEVLSDSSAARGFSARQGLGRMRHIQTRYLWVQERVRDGHLRVLPIRGKNNPADLFTKPVNGAVRERFLRTLGFVHVSASEKHKRVIGG